MSDTDTDSRWNKAAREKWLEERDNKPVLEFNLQKYLLQRIRLLNDYEITNAEFISSMLELQCLISDLDAANATIAECLEQSKRAELVRNHCKFQLRRLMVMEDLE